MMRSEILNPLPNFDQRGLDRFAVQMQPRQTQMIRMMKLGIQQTAGVERLQEFLIAQMSRSQHKRHKAIMTDAAPCPAPFSF